MTSFYKDKRVCVTGGCGFVGVQLVKKLLVAGAEVYVLDDMSRGKNTLMGATYVHSDATNHNTCNYAFRGGSALGEPVDMVFNLVAAVAGVLHNQGHHTDMFQSNIDLQTTPAIAAAQCGVKNFLQVSSVCVYAPHLNHPSKEENGMVDQPHIANDGYAWAKRMGEKVVEWAGLERAMIVRPSNVFGIHDYYDEKSHVIPALIKKVHAPDGKGIVLYGNPHAIREFVWSEDVADGMMIVMERGEHLEAYNIGNDSRSNRITMGDLLESIMFHSGVVKKVVGDRSRGGGDDLRWSDCTKARLLSYDPQVSIADGIKKILEEEWKSR